MFVLAMISIFASGSLSIERIGTFEHYGQCLQAEAAMSESFVYEPSLPHYQVYRCLALKVEDAK
jgi:hypothetical protein